MYVYKSLSKCPSNDSIKAFIYHLVLESTLAYHRKLTGARHGYMFRVVSIATVLQYNRRVFVRYRGTLGPLFRVQNLVNSQPYIFVHSCRESTLYLYVRGIVTIISTNGVMIGRKHRLTIKREVWRRMSTRGKDSGTHLTKWPILSHL